MTDENEDEIERLLAAVAPRKPPAELRAVVLTAVGAEVHRHRTGRLIWQRRLTRAVAASVLFSVAAFAGVSWYEARRMAKWDDRPLVRSDVVDLTAAIAEVTDDQSARAVEDYLRSQLQTGTPPAAAALRRDLEEIQRWSIGEPLAERSASDVKIQKRT